MSERKPRNYRLTTDTETAEIMRLYHEGLSIRGIALAMRMTYRTTANAIRAAGGDPRHRHGSPIKIVWGGPPIEKIERRLAGMYNPQVARTIANRVESYRAQVEAGRPIEFLKSEW